MTALTVSPNLHISVKSMKEQLLGLVSVRKDVQTSASENAAIDATFGSKVKASAVETPWM